MGVLAGSSNRLRRAPSAPCPDGSPRAATAGVRLRGLGAASERTLRRSLQRVGVVPECLAHHRLTHPGTELGQLGQRGQRLGPGLRVALLDQRQNDLLEDTRLRSADVRYMRTWRGSMPKRRNPATSLAMTSASSS